MRRLAGEHVILNRLSRGSSAAAIGALQPIWFGELYLTNKDLIS
jgi:hypothetical protein